MRLGTKTAVSTSSAIDQERASDAGDSRKGAPYGPLLIWFERRRTAGGDSVCPWSLLSTIAGRTMARRPCKIIGKALAYGPFEDVRRNEKGWTCAAPATS